MSALTPRQVRIAKWSAVPAAVLASGALIATASYSAFSAQTDNSGNAFAAGTIVLTDDDQGSALFSAPDLQPGQGDARCITVTSTGSLPSDVRLFTADAAATDALDVHLQVQVEQGTGGAVDCSDFVSVGSVFSGSLADLGAVTGHASGLDDWAPEAGDESRTYRVAYELSPTAPNSTQGGTAQIDFVWEAQTR